MKSLAGKINFFFCFTKHSWQGIWLHAFSLDVLRAYNARPKNVFRVSIELLKYEWKSGRRRNALRMRIASEGLQSFLKRIPNFHKWFYNSLETRVFYLTLAVTHLYVLLTALTELEELNVDRTVITNEGCTVLPSKRLFYHF